MSALGDALLLSTIQPYVDVYHMPTTAQIEPLSGFVVPVLENNIPGLLTALIGLLTGWGIPVQGPGIVLGGPNFSPTYQMIFTRV